MLLHVPEVPEGIKCYVDRGGYVGFCHKQVLSLWLLGLCAKYALKILWYGGNPGEPWSVLASSFSTQVGCCPACL